VYNVSEAGSVFVFREETDFIVMCFPPFPEGPIELIIPWSRAILEMLLVAQLVGKVPAFYGGRNFITAFIRTRPQTVF
jgi:hypothetical protein